MRGISMRRIGIALLACCIVCLLVGIILLPKQKLLLVDMKGIVKSAVWFVTGYIAGQAGLILLVGGMNREQVRKLEQLLDERLPVPPPPVRDPADIPPCDPSLLEE